MFFLDDTQNRGSDADQQLFNDKLRRHELINRAKINSTALNSNSSKLPQSSRSKTDPVPKGSGNFLRNSPEHSKNPKDPKSSKIDAAKSLLNKNSSDKNSALPTPTKDPRKMAAQVLDDTIGLGRKTGHLLFLIWEVSALGGSIPFIITGLPGIFMLNLLLISPKLAYRITIWILVFIPGVGEAAKAVDEVGLGKVDISISGAERFAIICTDFVWATLILLLFVFIVTVFCYNVNGTLGVVGAAIADWRSGTSFFSDLQTFCKGF